MFGTGGEILRSLQRLMGHLAGLREIELCDLLLERLEGMHALDEVRYCEDSSIWSAGQLENACARAQVFDFIQLRFARGVHEAPLYMCGALFWRVFSFPRHYCK